MFSWCFSKPTENDGIRPKTRPKAHTSHARDSEKEERRKIVERERLQTIEREKQKDEGRTKATPGNPQIKTNEKVKDKGNPKGKDTKLPEIKCNEPEQLKIPERSKGSQTKNTKNDFSQFEEECLRFHNLYRARHKCPPLQLSHALNKVAHEWAKHMAKTNTMQHRPKGKYGENLYMGSGWVVTAEDVVKSWYEEIENYNFQQPGFSSSTGHFTQVIWKDTQLLGVGVETKDNRTWVVCNYDPPGNVLGRFPANVPQDEEIKDKNKTAARENKPQELKRYEPEQLKTPERSHETSKEKTGKKESETKNTTNDFTQFEEECLRFHNFYRAKHKCPPLQLSHALNKVAHEWAKHMAKTNRMEHRPKNKYGENLYMGSGWVVTAEDAVKSWYEEIESYNFQQPGFSSSTGHFTQVIWKDTQLLGVGVETKDNRTWVVCNYDPPGNVLGRFPANVPPLK